MSAHGAKGTKTNAAMSNEKDVAGPAKPRNEDQEQRPGLPYALSRARNDRAGLW
jgi:hypothetical protein